MPASARVNDEALEIALRHPALRAVMDNETEVAFSADDIHLLAATENIHGREARTGSLAYVHAGGRQRGVGARAPLGLCGLDG